MIIVKKNNNEAAAPLKTFRLVREVVTSTYERAVVQAADERAARDMVQDSNTDEWNDAVEWTTDGEPEAETTISLSLEVEEEIDGVTKSERKLSAMFETK
jgi:hypothetical protein